MKIGVYVSGYEPEAGGGYTFESEVLRALLAVAKPGGHLFCVLCAQRDFESLRGDPRLQDLEIVPLPDIGGAQRIISMLERESPIFRAHWRRPSSLDRAAAAAGVDFIWFIGAGVHKTDLPYLTVVWDLQHRSTPWFPEFSASGVWDQRELSQAWFLQRAAGVITGTRVGQNELARYYQVAPERTLLLAHPTPRFALDAGGEVDAQLPPSVRTPFLLYPAQFWSHKNHVTLIRALANLHRSGATDLSLVFVGSDKGNRAHVEQVAREEGVHQAVVFLGFVPQKTLVTLYRNAVALTYLSFCGPENMPPLEAFALGCPVVAAQVPGADEQLGDNALLVPPTDPAAIAAAVTRIREDQGLRAELVRRGRIRAGNWTAEHYVHEVFDFLNRFSLIRQSWPTRLPATSEC